MYIYHFTTLLQQATSGPGGQPGKWSAPTAGCRFCNLQTAGSPVKLNLAVHVLHKAASDNDNLVAAWANVLDAQVHHAAQVGVFGLEEFSCCKENIRGLLLQVHTSATIS